MDLIEPRLSSAAQHFWPKSLVVCRNHGSGLDRWLLHRSDGRPVDLGDSLEEAESTLHALAAAGRAAR